MYAATGIISATAFYGSGENLSDIIKAKLSGISVFEDGTPVGIPYQFSELNFVGNYITSSGIGSTAIITLGIPPYADVAGIATYASNAGIATFATTAGIATYASNAGIATYATNAGIATYASNAGIATYATNAGIATYATNAGIATYATNAGIATYATNAGIATYASNAGISTSVIGGIGSIAQLQVTGISTFTNGPVLIGSATSTGTAGQILQVAGISSGAYIGGNLGIGTTNPVSNLQVEGNVLINGNLNVSIGTTNPIISALVGQASGYNVLGIAVTQTRNGIGIGTTNPFIPFYSDSDSIISNTVTLYNTEWIVANSYNNSVTRLGADSGRSLEIGMGNTNFPKYIDFGGGNFPQFVYPDYQARIIRNSNDNGSFEIVNRGTGGIKISSGQTSGEASHFEVFSGNQRSFRVNSNAEFLINTTSSTGTASQRLQVNSGAYVSGSVGIGTTNPSSPLTVIGDARVSGVVTATTFVGALTGTATTATKLETARTFQITGDVVASAISFDGTGNVSLAATIQPNSVALGSDTTGDYVQSITGTSNQITVTGGTGESSTPVLSLPNNLVIPQDATVTRDLQVNRNLNVTGNITIGGTTAFINVPTLTVFDPDIVLGFRTDAFGNDISNDNTANHGGVALASTEGTPLVNLFIAGIETNPATYKKIMWFKSGTFAGLGTDAWLINYAVGIGSTQFPNGTRLAAGSVQFTENDLAVVRNINASGVGTIPTLSGTTATYTTGNFTTGNIVTGIVTTLTSTNATLTNINSSGISTLGITTFTGTVSFGTSAYFGDDDRLYFGDSNDLEIYHSGTTSFILDNGFGNLALGSNGDRVSIVKGTGGETLARFNIDDSVELWFNNVKTFETTGYGATVFGILQSQGLQINSGVSTLGITTATNLTTQNIDNSGITTTNSLNIGATQVISSARQLQNIASLDATTTATIESAIANAPNTFTDLNVTGISTLGVTSATNLTAQQLNVSGVSTLGNVSIGAGNTTLIVSGTVRVSGASTFDGNVTLSTGTLTALGGMTVAGGVNFSNVTSNITAASQTTGTLTLGGPVQTGTIVVGQSTASQTTNIQAGASGVGTTKTINFGTGGASGSFTQINIGPTAGVGTVLVNTGTRLGIGSAIPTSALTVIGNARVSGVVTATTFIGALTGTATYATNAGIATYASNAGIATFATTAGIATYATNAGIATYATNAGIATYADTAGFSTFSGYASNAGIATYADTAGFSTFSGYATTAGIATYATTAGIATFASNAGIATYASNAGIATYASNAGIATYASNAGIATYASNAGIATYASNAGIATYASNAGIATYASNAGIATYASNAGIATTANNVSSSININTSGIITATSFSGSGTNLTGIVTSIVAGTNITVSGSTGQVTINSTGGGGGGSIAILDNTSTNDTFYVGIASTTTGDLATLNVSSTKLTFNPSTGNLVAGGTVTANSDEKLKENIKTIENALEKVLSLRGVEYDRIDTGDHQIGVIAQEVERIIPDVVYGDETKSVAYGNIVGLLIEAIKDQNKRIEELERRLEGN
jgi:hypothetical protein